jgi:hypothetical protein
MLNQFCNACGSQVVSNSNQPLEFCTNCGTPLPKPQTQANALGNQTVPYGYGTFGSSGGRRFGKGGDRTLFWVLMSVLGAFVLTGVIGVAIIFFAASRRTDDYVRYPPRTTPTPTPKATNLLLSFGKDGLGAGEFKRAESIAVDRDGNIYVGDGTLRIQKFDASGKFLQLWNVTESEKKADEKYYTAVDYLAIDSKNRLYAVVENDLLRYEAATGKFIDKIDLYGEKWFNKTQKASIEDIQMLNDDRLAVFATSFPEGEYIIMVSPEGKPEIKFKDLWKNQAKRPTKNVLSGRMIINVTGDMFLMENMATEKEYLYHFKADGTYVDRFTWEGAPGFGVFGRKTIAFNSKGEIFAYNGSKKQISVLSTDGVMLRSFPLAPDSFDAMTLDAADNIYVVSDKKIEKFAAQ